MMNAAFTAHEITVNGKTFPTEYSISPSGTVFAFVTVQENGQPVSLRIKIDPADPNHAAALAAAQQERNKAHPAEASAEPEAPAQPEQTEAPAEPEAPAQQEQTEAPAPDAEPEASTQQEQTEAPAPDAEPEASTQQEQTEAPAPDAEPEAPARQEQAEAPEEPARNPKQARGPVPEKNFIGLEIKGNGWKIVFDGSYDRTRVIFKRKPSMKAREAVKNAGFYWSPSMQSWNKNLTFRAWRAAQSLAMELKTICG